jgi:DnaJ like chaperone protein
MLLAQAQFSGAGGTQGNWQGGAGTARHQGSLSQAYKVLGLDEQASDAEIKRAYRKLMSEHHPDRLAAKGVPEEMIRVATERSAEISTAYDMIKKHRGFK